LVVDELCREQRRRPKESRMKLETEFYKLPVTFDAERVLAELSAIEPYRWVPQGSPRYLCLPLVSHHGLDTGHPSPPTWPTAHLARCPYLRQVLACFRSPLTDVRVRRVEPGSSGPAHYDGHFASFSRYRLHLPLVTDESILFRCNGRQVHMGRGEVWVFDRLSLYGITSPTDAPRVHITVETGGSSALWNMLQRSVRPFDARHTVSAESEQVPYQPKWEASVLTENTPGAAILPPGELEAFLVDLLDRVRDSTVRDPKGRDEAVRAIHRFSHDWRTLWSLAGADVEAWPRYRNLCLQVLHEVARHESRLGSICDLRPGLTVRLQDFLTTGAFNPRMSPYPVDSAPTPERIYELIADPLMRLGPDGGFEAWNPVSEETLPLSAEDVDFLRCFATPRTVLDAADAAGFTCDTEMLARVRWYAQQHMLRPLRAMPGLPSLPAAQEPADLATPGVVVPMSTTGERPAVDTSSAMAPARSGLRVGSAAPTSHFPLRLQDGIYFRLTPRSSDLFVWVPQLGAFRSLNWYWLRLAAALATGQSVRQAAETAGLVYDDQVEAAVSMLLDHGVLVPMPGAAQRRARVG
jgi:hypothetical protein